MTNTKKYEQYYDEMFGYNTLYDVSQQIKDDEKFEKKLKMLYENKINKN